MRNCEAGNVKKNEPEQKTFYRFSDSPILRLIFVSSLLTAILAAPGCKGKVSPPVQPASSNSSEQTIGRSGVAATGDTATIEKIIVSGAPAADNPALVSRIEITPKAPKVGDTITINLIPNPGVSLSSVPIAFEWRKNGEVLSDTSHSLAVDGRFKRGDKVEVNITVDDEKGPKQSWLASVVIANSPPVITPATELIKVNGSTFSFQVNANDPDGDSLSYSLKSGPPGTTIDPATGKVTFTVPADNKASIPIVVLVSDGHGGEAAFNFEMGK